MWGCPNQLDLLCKQTTSDVRQNTNLLGGETIASYAGLKLANAAT